MLRINELSVKLGSFALNDVSFEVSRGDYFVLLGMSGSGKSVLLQVIGGLIKTDNGGIFLNGSDITREKIQRRNVGLVFQDAALFPHMTVAGNIAYPLKSLNLGRREIHGRVSSLAGLTMVSHLLKRSPANLSGGEKQRVALARALALEPACLLLDEPLSSLDVQLRGELRALLRKINEGGQTIVHVTHDYEEAVQLATRVGVIENGTVVQTGTPSEVFRHPRSVFMARFAGIRNFFSGTLLEGASSLRQFKSNGPVFNLLSDEPSCEGFVVIKDRDITLSEEKIATSAVNNLKGIIKATGPAWLGTEVIIDAGVEMCVQLTDQSAARLNLEPGKEVWLSFKASAIRFIRK